MLNTVKEHEDKRDTKRALKLLRFFEEIEAHDGFESFIVVERKGPKKRIIITPEYITDVIDAINPAKDALKELSLS